MESYNKSDQAYVEDAEELLLCGDFRKSLMLCNQVLNLNLDRKCSEQKDDDDNDNKETNASTTKTAIINFPLETPLCLSIDASPTRQRRLTVQVNFEEPNQQQVVSLVDRAATVALQSWYEIMRKLKEQEYARRKEDPECLPLRAIHQGYVHLLPFLNTYTTKAVVMSSNNNNGNDDSLYGGRPMPLEVAVVFIQFLRTDAADGLIEEAVTLCCELLFRITGHAQFAADSRTTTNTMSPLRCLLEDLLTCLVLEILPFVSNPGVVVAWLQSLQLKPKQDESAKMPVKKNNVLGTRDKANPDALAAILSFLKSPPPHWSQNCFPSQECLQMCETTLQRQLKLTKHDANNGSTESNTLLPSSKGATSNSESPSNSLMSSKGGVLVVSDWIAKVSRSVGTLIKDLGEQKSGLAFLFLMVLLFWRQRKRAGQLSAAALHSLLAPFREIVEALFKA